jgi:hypothetical protein
MHLEHGGALPRDLQGDPVEYYYSVRDEISTPKFEFSVSSIALQFELFPFKHFDLSLVLSFFVVDFGVEISSLTE